MKLSAICILSSLVGAWAAPMPKSDPVEAVVESRQFTNPDQPYYSAPQELNGGRPGGRPKPRQFTNPDQPYYSAPQELNGGRPIPRQFHSPEQPYYSAPQQLSGGGRINP